MNKTIRMSTIIREARDKYLWDGIESLARDKYLWDGIESFELKKEIYSCMAIDKALKEFYRNNMLKRFKAEDIIDHKLESLGCEYYSCSVFSEFKFKEERQAARFVWLSFLIEATKNVKLKL